MQNKFNLKLSKNTGISVHKCHCNFIPNFIFDNLGASGVDAAPLSAQQSKLSRGKRQSRVNNMQEFVSLKSVGNSDRQVYDCQNKWQQRIELVRKENESDTGDEGVDQAFTNAGLVRDFLKTSIIEIQSMMRI